MADRIPPFPEKLQTCAEPLCSPRGYFHATQAEACFYPLLPCWDCSQLLEPAPHNHWELGLGGCRVQILSHWKAGTWAAWGLYPAAGEMVDTELEFLRENEGPDWEGLKSIHSFTYRNAFRGIHAAGLPGRPA